MCLLQPKHICICLLLLSAASGLRPVPLLLNCLALLLSQVTSVLMTGSAAVFAVGLMALGILSKLQGCL